MKEGVCVCETEQWRGLKPATLGDYLNMSLEGEEHTHTHTTRYLPSFSFESYRNSVSNSAPALFAPSLLMFAQ